MKDENWSIHKYIDDKLKKGMLNIIILKIANKQKTYPYALLKTLRKSPNPMINKITKNEVYNILNSLEKKEFIKSKFVSKGTKVQKYYAVTKKGERVLIQSKIILNKSINEMKKLVKEEFYE